MTVYIPLCETHNFRLLTSMAGVLKFPKDTKKKGRFIPEQHKSVWQKKKTTLNLILSVYLWTHPGKIKIGVRCLSRSKIENTAVIFGKNKTVLYSLLQFKIKCELLFTQYWIY